MNVHRLPPSEHRAGLAHALPHLRLVRGAADSAAGQDANARSRLDCQAHQGACGLAGAWTQRTGLTLAGEGVDTARADWPGRASGIRAPEQDETPLSAAEVLHALKIKLIADADDEIDKWPAVRVYRPAGAWVSAIPGAARTRWFDAVVTA
jgi:hypothetical protein